LSAGLTATGVGAAAVPAVVALGEGAINSALALWGRNLETGAELFSSYQEKVLHEVQNGNINLQEVLAETDENLAALGYDVDNMDEMERFQAALSTRIQTSNPTFNKIMDDAYDGLEGVRDTNNALVVSDILQTGMFSYGGKLLKGATSLGKLGQIGGKVLSPGLTTTLGKTVDRGIVKAADKLAKSTLGKVNLKTAFNGLL
jgi:hypothetical protein